MMDKLLHDIWEGLVALLLGLLPAALGAAVSLAYETALTWAQRFVQLAVGVVVSYFATGVIAAIWPHNWWGPLDPFVRQAIGFVAGMIAFKAVPKFRDAIIEAVGEIPGQLRDAIPFLRRKEP